MPSVRVRSFFTFKDKLRKMLLSGLVYKYKCGDCNAAYYGKTKCHFKVRICEHLRITHWKKTTSYVAATLHPMKTFLF